MTVDKVFRKPPPVAEKTVVYRVLKRYQGVDGMNPHRRWIEQEPLTITSEYPYPAGRIVGEQYGEGDYIILPPIGTYERPRFLTVVADRVYREAEEAE